MTLNPRRIKKQERQWLRWITLLCVIIMFAGLVYTRSSRDNSTNPKEISPTQEELTKQVFQVLEQEQCTAMGCDIYMRSMVVLEAWHHPDIINGNKTYTFAITEGDLYDAMRRLGCTPNEPCWVSSSVETIGSEPCHVIELSNGWNNRNVRLRVK